MSVDPFAVDLCPFPFRPLLRAYGATGTLEPVRSVYRAASLGMVDHVSLRTSAIDRGVGGALADGAEQIVLLGAGLDARSRRLPALAGHTVFEVDHPATQRYKRTKMGEREGLRYVAVDFERDDLGQRLAEAGFDVGRVTAWIWEGVTMYLAPAAVEATLGQLERLSAPGSRLLASYMVPNSVPFGPAGALLVRHAFDAIGEGLHATYERRDMNALLARHGFSVLTDTNSVDWAESAGVSAWQTKIFRGERLVIARRD
ncbi:MAG: SAM-dependent methyltransferase [Myxococcales bacterium]|nr:SAM-dependent methyltransferase [Myxococcales bacterium]MCB9628534.1 SAM-dependent methyltransferase [Sandaracinaceae bacterium]